MRTEGLARKDSLQADCYICEVCESSPQTRAVFKILHHTREHCTGTVVCNDVTGWQMRAPSGPRPRKRHICPCPLFSRVTTPCESRGKQCWGITCGETPTVPSTNLQLCFESELVAPSFQGDTRVIDHSTTSLRAFSRCTSPLKKTRRTDGL